MKGVGKPKMPRIALASVLVALMLAVPGARAEQTGPGQPPPATAGCDPSFGGKYTGLVRQLPVPEDEAQYGKCHDYGAWNGTEYKGHANLPANAYWTYSAPNWHVWTDRAAAPRR